MIKTPGAHLDDTRKRKLYAPQSDASAANSQRVAFMKVFDHDIKALGQAIYHLFRLSEVTPFLSTVKKRQGKLIKIISVMAAASRDVSVESLLLHDTNNVAFLFFGYKTFDRRTSRAT